MTEPITNGTSRWQKAETVFQQALDRPTAERPAYVAEACGTDASLRADVESLLAAAGRGGWTEAVATGWQEVYAGDHWEGRRVGAYRLVRELGRGGMGVVYLAGRADAAYEQQVAVKLVGGASSRGLAARLQQERGILARLEHPAIARLLDGGETEEGVPYLVMEFVAGEPITAYCAARRLPVAARLRLFQEVCVAVEYAHRQLVVHRDLKPNNILVSDEGRPKLLDFGIATLINTDLQDQTPVTATLLRLMTPQYASPEQVRGEPVSTATDVYSLGLVLYELLTERRPYEVTALPPLEVIRVVCDSAPVKPSVAAANGPRDRLARHLRGDLDNIVLMALRKEPERRYGSAAHLSEDIDRYLTGQPVRARKATVGYRAGKFVRRHAVGVAASLAVLATLVGGIVTTRQQALVAEQRFADVRKLANALLFELHDAIADLPGATPARELVVKRALEYLDRLAGQAGDDLSLQRELAAAYHKVAEVQGNPTQSNLGDSAGAARSYEKAVELRQRIVSARPGDVDARRDLVLSLFGMAVLLEDRADIAGSASVLKRATTALQEGSSSKGAPAALRPEFASALSRLGDIQVRTSRTGEALENYQRALAIHQELAAEGKDARRNVAVTLAKIGGMRQERGDPAGALADFRESLRVRLEVAAAAPNDATAKRSVFVGYNMIGDAAGNPNMNNAGDLPASLEAYRKGLEIAQALAAGDPKNARARRDLTIGHNRLGDVLGASGDWAGALESFRQALQICEALSKLAPENAEALRDVALSQARVGTALAGTGDGAAALQMHRQALDIRLDLARRDPQNSTYKQDLYETRQHLGALLVKEQRFTDAFEQLDHGRSLAEALAAADKSSAQLRRNMVIVYRTIGDAHAGRARSRREKADWPAARQAYQQALDIARAMREAGTLAPGDKTLIDELSTLVTECDRAMAEAA